MADPSEYSQFYASVVQPPDDDPVPPDVIQLSGFDALQAAEREAIRVAISLLLSITKAFFEVTRRSSLEVLKSYGQASRTLLQMLVPSTTDQSPPPFEAVRRRSHLSGDQVREQLRAATATTCISNWGPPEGCVRDLLSVSAMAFYTWVGGPLTSSILEFVYSFSSDAAAWATVWLHCPVDHAHLDFPALALRVKSQRARSTHSSPAAMVSQLASLAISAIEPIVRSMYTAATILPGTAAEYFEDQMFRPTFAQVVAASAPQYAGIVRSNLVLSSLPSTSSLPQYTPNFVDDSSATWFRSADYFFASIQFPLSDAVRGDASAERRWHHYVCEVLNNRMLCMKLSESQVIKHLSKGFTRDAMHYQVATEKAMSPECTVREWLDAIRDFFFTNGQFRMHIEGAWSKYRAGKASSFNDLVHHVRIYYQLIFLDYSDLPGKMTLQDFAWNLFDKMQHLMSPECTSELSSTIKMFMPLPDLLQKLSTHLENGHTWPIERANALGTEFISWCVDKLNSAKETANTAKRFAAFSANHYQGVDFASTSTHATPNRDAPPLVPLTKRGQRQITMAYNRDGTRRPGPHSGQHTSNRGPTVQPNTPPATAHGERLPGLREARRLPFQQKQAWLEDTMSNTAVPQWIKDVYAFEVANPNAPCAIHALGAACRKGVPYYLPFTPVAVAMFLLEATFVHRKRVCGFCPATMSDGDRFHRIKDCPTARSLAPEALAAWAQHPANKNKCLMAVEPADELSPPPPPPPPTAATTPEAAPSRNRKRYEDSSQPPNKRARAPSTNHIR